MIVINDSAVGTDRNVNTSLFIVFISCCSNIKNCRSLTTANTLLLSCNADGSAADSYLNEISSVFSKESESFAVNNVACPNLNGITVCIADPLKRPCLPFGISFRRVNRQDIYSGFKKSGDPFLIISGIDTSTNDVSLVLIQKFKRVVFVSIIVFAEDQSFEVHISVNYRELIDLVTPDDVVSLSE